MPYCILFYSVSYTRLFFIPFIFFLFNFKFFPFSLIWCAKFGPQIFPTLHPYFNSNFSGTSNLKKIFSFSGTSKESVRVFVFVVIRTEIQNNNLGGQFGLQSCTYAMISVHIALHNDFGFIHASVHNALINNCGSDHFYLTQKGPNYSFWMFCWWFTQSMPFLCFIICQTRMFGALPLTLPGGIFQCLTISILDLDN